ncbi:MAG: hypothetical protein HY925_13325, partial [Elusimicrobia bacterium]|nr:hypothetical protein [Elusimicrobiota bacterium]
MAHAIAIPIRRPVPPQAARPPWARGLAAARRVPWAGLLALGLAALALFGKPAQSSWWLAAQAGLVSTLLFARRFGVPPRSDQDEVLQTVSHDLRAPLAATEGYIKYLMGCEPGTLNAEQLDLLNTALANLNRLEHFVNDTLDLARLDAGKMDYKVAAVDASAAVEQVLALFRF